MSDRPMRLKYLKTKMKILCFFLLWILAVSVFSEPQELNGIVGESVKFPAAVKINGILRYSGVTIGTVTSRRFTPLHNVEYSDRVHWDSSTGLLSLFGLRMEDSGVYTVQDTQQNINTTFQLNVYKDNVPVSKPNVIFHNEYCTIECTADRGTGATLSWYREGQTKPFVSSRVASAPHLHLPETVESGTYTCEAKNSVSSKTSDPLTVGAHCTAGPSAWTIVFGISAVVALFAAGFFAYMYRHEKRQAVIRDVVRRLILVIKLLNNIVEPASDEDRQAFIYDAFTRLILVYEISEDIVAPAHALKTSIQQMQALRSKVINLLDILVGPEFDIRSLIRDIRSIRRAIRTTILDGDEQAVFLRDIRSLIRDVNDILVKVDPHTYRLLGVFKGKNELGAEEAEHSHLRDDLS